MSWYPLSSIFLQPTANINIIIEDITMSIDFPDSPSSGDTYSYDGKQWTYDGEKWETSGGSKGQKGEAGAGGGEKGETGNTGATGPTGNKGEKGELGPQGNTGPASSVAGPTGPQGVAGGTFVGARYTPSANVATTTAGFDGTISSTVAVPIDVQVYDTNSIVSANTITIPSGVTYAEIFAHTRLENGGESSPRTHVFKGTTLIKSEYDSSTGASGTRGTDITTGIIPVSAGDTFTVRISSNNTGVKLDTGNSYVGFHATVTGTTAQGDKGQKGDDSTVPGPTGPQGGTGPTGVKGEKGEASTVVGPQGAQGPAGSDGAKGEVGPQGATGPTGAGSTQSLTLGANGNLSISGSNNVDLRQTQYLYSTTGDLPSASTYHGAIAHVHAEGALYFAHGGSWNKLANDSSAVSSSSETTFTADVNFDTGVSEKFSTLTGATGVVTHDCDNGHIFYHTSISADFTANFTNLGLSTNYSTNLTLILNQGATAYIPSAVQIGGSAQTINWQGGSAPTGTVNGIDAVSFTVLEVSGTYVVLGQLVDFT